MNPLIYQLYLLQIEDYKIGRFWRLLFQKGIYFPGQPLRKKLVWTKKAILIFVLAIILFCLIAYLSFSASLLSGILVTVISLLIFPLFYTLLLIIILPFDLIGKIIVKSRAKRTIGLAKDLKIIGIAGSYGKTTLRNLLCSVLKEKYKVLSPEGNINTAVGISAWINANNISDSDVLIIEFGEEYLGDNKKIAEIFKTDIVIITGVNEAHLERFGSIEKTAEAIFESVKYAKPEAKVFINSSDNNAISFYSKYVGKREVVIYKDESTNKKFDQDNLSQSAEFSGIGQVKTKILGDYIFSDIAISIMIANLLELSKEQVGAGVEKLAPIKHRLEPIKGAGDVLVIDDSYNGNPAGVESAINLLGFFERKRKIFLTPGLVETGAKNNQVHEKIGMQLAKVADKIILIKNSATIHIAKGLSKANFSDENVIWFDSGPEAHKNLSNILKPGDVILFQNDWGDQYF